MKKVLSLAVCLLLILALAACGSARAEIVMIPDAAGIDDESFNQGTWEGVRLYAGFHDKSCNYYQPTAENDDAYLTAIDKAVQGGAKVIVLPGHAFEFAVGTAQVSHPDVAFILLDSNPADGAADNTVGITFAEEQAGYLAGWAAVMDGYRQLGFIGGAPVPGVAGYGLGYVQGAGAAAAELGEDVVVRYTYNGQFVENEEARALAADWYQNGTEVIFACGGAMNRSVFSAAEELAKKSIGVDVDQSGVSNTVITSAVKGLGEAAGKTLEQYFSGSFPGGQSLVMGIPEGAVGLAMENSRFETFTQEDYDQILRSISEGEVTVTRGRGTVDETSISPMEAGAIMSHLEIEYLE